MPGRGRHSAAPPPAAGPVAATDNPAASTLLDTTLTGGNSTNYGIIDNWSDFRDGIAGAGFTLVNAAGASIYTSGYSQPVVMFNVQGGMITSSGSTLDGGASLIVVFPYTNVTMTVYCYDTISIASNGSFSHTWGSVSVIGGQKTVTGTIASATHASGTASHVENSGYMGFTGNMTYNWVADR